MIEETEPADGAPIPAPPRVRRTLRNRQESTQRRKRVLISVLFIGSAVLMVNALVGENGYLATVRARREYNALMNNIARLRFENQDLIEEIHRLKYDPTAIEDVARRDLGLIRPGETLVIIHNSTPAVPASVPR